MGYNHPVINQDFVIRELGREDQDFLFEMLYQSVYTGPGSPPPDRSILSDPKIRHYVEGWGGQGDFGYAAVDNKTGEPVGAVWLRYFKYPDQGYGYIDDAIPELGIAVDSRYRGQGTGTALLEALLNYADGRIETLSLSVDPENPAVNMYKRFGFTPCGTEGTSIIMRRDNRSSPL